MFRRNCFGNHCKLLLNLPDFISGRTYLQIIPRPGCRDTGNLLRCIDKHIITIIITENFYRFVVLIPKIFASPLTQPVAARHALSVTILCQDWLSHIRSGKIILKHFIYHIRDTLKNISSIYEFLVVSSGCCDGEVIAFVPVHPHHWIQVIFHPKNYQDES